MKRKVLLGLAFVAALGGMGVVRIAQQNRDLEEHETFYVFGTLVEVSLSGVSENSANAAFADISQTLRQLHRDWHAWHPGGMVETLNQDISAGKGGEIDERTAALLRQGQVLSCESGGLFDPGIGKIIGLWGFHQDTPPEGPPPPVSEISAIVNAHPSISDLAISGTHVTSSNPQVSLDLGGYAKGAALDLLEEHLRARGIDNAVLNAGGDVDVMGRHDRRPWRVAIRDPFVWGAVASVQMKPGEVLYTSGNYERYFDYNGIRFAHILDPRTGWPVQDIVSVSVLGMDGERADAAATALSVAGVKDWPKIAAQMKVRDVLMITGDGRMLATPSMAKRLDPVGGSFPAPLELVTLPEAGQLACE